MPDDYTTEYWVDAPPERVYAAIVDVPSFWAPSDTVVGASVEGNSEHEGDEFIYRDRAFRVCRIRIEQAQPAQRMVWKVIDADLNDGFTDPHEWTGTRIVFRLTPHDGGTQLHFTHEGLTPAFECYEACSTGWDGVINDSLKRVIAAAA